MEERRSRLDNLAVTGGPKTRTEPMPPRMAFGGDEFPAAVEEVFAHYRARKADFGYQDTFERLYTDAFVRYMEVDGYADAVNTGTAALFVAIAALQLPAGSEVLVSPITDPGTINAIILNGLRPRLVDSSPGSYNVGVAEIEPRIGDQTRAMVIVHAAGKPAPIDEIVRLARERGLLVVEDCSQAHGSRWEGHRIGTFGDIAAFSTMYRKAHATGSCGGVIFTRSQERYNLVRAYADRGKPFWQDGFNDKDPTTFLFPALNFNIDEISCAIGLKSLERLETTRQRRIAFLEAFNDALRQASEVCTPSSVSTDDSPFFHPIFVDPRRLTCSVRDFANAVRSEGIDVNPHYDYVVCEWPYVRPYLADEFECRNAIECRDNSFNLLLNENYGEQEVRDIVRAIVKVEKAYGIESRG
jgi:perosamine synthetase